MSPRRPSAPDTESEPALPFTDSTAEWLRPRLTTATKEELVALVERLAGGSEDIAARINYLTNPSAAVKGLQRRIAAIRNGKRFIAYDETGQVATEIASIAADIRTDVLPRDPKKAVALAEKLFCLDQVIFERADDSDGRIGEELREACVLWLDAAAAVRGMNADGGTDWSTMLYEFYQANDYGIREPLLEEGHRLLREDELRALAAGFENDARETLDAASAAKVERHRVFGASSAMGLVARALRDPKLYEQSIRRSRMNSRRTTSPSSTSYVAMAPVRCAGFVSLSERTLDSSASIYSTEPTGSWATEIGRLRSAGSSIGGRRGFTRTERWRRYCPRTSAVHSAHAPVRTRKLVRM